MPDYKKMYYILFNQMSKTIEQLQVAQQETEELYINSADTPLNIIEKIKPDTDRKNISSVNTSADNYKKIK